MTTERPARVVVTPAGRRRYVELLYRHLASQRGSFDRWQLWLNTTDAADLEYLCGLAAANPDWITARELTVPHRDNASICSFFPGASDRGTTYLRLDDDVVWMEPGFVDAMMSYREAHRDPFLVYGSIVNNSVVTHLFQRFGAVDDSLGTVGYSCSDDVGWKSGPFAQRLHEAFLADVARGDVSLWRFPAWVLYDYERVSINCISWLGDDFADFGGVVGDDEEQWLAVEKPRALGRPNVVAGGLPGKLCAHFAFFTQRPTLDATSILASYEALAPPLALTEVVSMNSDGRFEAFVRDLPSCADADGLAELIGSLGLFADNRDLYAPRFAHRQLDKGGMWQEPSELAEALWSLRDELRAVHALHQQPERPLRFLEIGTFTGYTFFVIREFIRAHVTSNLLARTYDPNDLVSDDIRAWIERDFVRGTSAEAAEAPWDFVFIDGCHEAPWPLLDFERLHTGAKIVMFHDVVDRYCPDVRDAFRHLSSKYESRVVSRGHRPDVFGIGIVYPTHRA